MGRKGCRMHCSGEEDCSLMVTDHDTSCIWAWACRKPVKHTAPVCSTLPPPWEFCCVSGTNMPNVSPDIFFATATASRHQVSYLPGNYGLRKTVPPLLLPPVLWPLAKGRHKSLLCQQLPESWTQSKILLLFWKYFTTGRGEERRRWKPISRLSALNQLLLKSCICTLFGISRGSRLQLFKIKWCLKLILLTDERILIDE